MASQHSHRIERIERRLREKRDGGCLACTLARMGGSEGECDGQCCGLGLADLLMQIDEGRPNA